MTSIRSFSDILRSDTKLTSDELQYFSGIINDESQRLTRLLDEILDLSFLESGQVKLNLKSTTLNSVLKTALQSTQQTTSNANAQITVAPDSIDTVLTTDPDRLSQVFINLITNTVKYTNKTTPILTISCQQAGSYLNVTFQDNGPGIPVSERTIIFEKFSKLSNATSSSGVGLGLAISQEIMRNLGGTLTCLNSDTGARFQVSIPLNS